MSASFGRFKEPTALMTNRAWTISPGAVRGAELDAPLGALVVPAQRGDVGVEPTVRSQPVLVDDDGEILPELRLLAVELAPMIRGLEGVTVLVAPDIDAGARIPVLPPRAAGTGILVNDGKREAGLLQADTGEDPSHAATDDQDR